MKRIVFVSSLAIATASLGFAALSYGDTPDAPEAPMVKKHVIVKKSAEGHGIDTDKLDSCLKEAGLTDGAAHHGKHKQVFIHKNGDMDVSIDEDIKIMKDGKSHKKVIVKKHIDTEYDGDMADMDIDIEAIMKEVEGLEGDQVDVETTEKSVKVVAMSGEAMTHTKTDWGEVIEVTKPDGSKTRISIENIPAP